MNQLLVILGALGLLLGGAGVFGLLLEIMRRRPHRWPALLLAGGAYLAALFVAPPPPAWQALQHGGDLGTSLRAAGLGAFVALMCLAYINACRRVDELCSELEVKQ